jgi:TrmH family RNA methyltransferase
MQTINSRNNPKIKTVRQLRQRKGRQELGLFLVEGVRPVGEAVEAGADIEALYYAPDLLTSAFARDLVDRQAGEGVPVYALAAGVFASIADKENPQGILAVVRQRQETLAGLTPLNFDWGVALVAPQDPGNLGTILRTIDAVGASGLLLLDSAADITHPSAVRASMGALFWYPVASASFDEFAGWAQGNRYHITGTTAHAVLGDRKVLDYRQVGNYPRPRLLLMGSEREGLSANQAAICERLVSLPMRGKATSLNLGVATGIFLYDMLSKDG